MECFEKYLDGKWSPDNSSDVCIPSPFPPSTLHSLLDRYMQYCVPADFIWQKPIHLPGTEVTLLLLPFLLTTLTEPDMVVVNIFKNNTADHSKQMEQKSFQGKK